MPNLKIFSSKKGFTDDIIAYLIEINRISFCTKNDKSIWELVVVCGVLNALMSIVCERNYYLLFTTL